MTLHDLDTANVQQSQKLIQRMQKTEVNEKVWQEINKSVNRYLEQGIAELQSGVLFIDEAHQLDVECVGFLSKALESPYGTYCDIFYQ